MPLKDRSVLIVEDEGLIATVFSDILEDMGMRVCGIATTASQAIEIANSCHPDIVLMDVNLEGEQDGIEAAKKIYQHRHVPIIFITGSTDKETFNRIQLGHPAAILFKPINARTLRTAVESNLP